MSPPSVAIIGAGPAGLSLARILKVRLESLPPNSLDITIFERDSNQHSQTDQIGTLDLHLDTGLAAMQAAGLFEEFLQYARYDGEELVIGDKNGTEMVHMVPGGDTTAGVEQSRPEIDRETLVEVLLKSVGKDKIQWGKKLKSVREDGFLDFADGSSAGPFDLVVGSDGSWSKVRPLLTTVKPRYSGICGFESLIVNPDEDYPEISKMLGRGAYFAFSDNKSMMSHRLGSNNLKLNYWMEEDESFHAEVMKAIEGDESKLRRILQDRYTGWLPALRKCINASSHFRSRALYELPVGDKWQHKKGFTLIGDSAHLMTPFSGKGANAAMRDALDLANAIADCLKVGGDLDAAVKDFEEQMFPRAHKVQELTMMHKVHMYAADAPIGFMVGMMDVIAEAKGRSLDEGFLKWIPVKKSVYFLAWLMTSLGGLKRRVKEWYWPVRLA
ncbi:hypothetical protein ACLMJK_001955 [Lecanora helva]